MDFCDEKLSVAASGRPGLPTAAMVSDLGAGDAGFAGTAGDCCLFLS